MTEATTKPVSSPVDALRGASTAWSYPSGVTPPRVSILIVAHNAAAHISECLESFRGQDYPRDAREFILVHSDAADGTREAMEQWRETLGRDEQVVILANVRRHLSAGWNLAISAARGDILVRVDAHAKAEPGFLSRNVQCMVERGEAIVGGLVDTERPTSLEGRLCWLVYRSLFGAGQASYRRGERAGYVDTLAYAAIHRRVYETVGGYDERLVRNQDNEMHYRMKRAGFRFYFDPTIRSTQRSRSTLRDMARQKFLSGYWVSLTLPVSPHCFSARHFIPGAFVIAVILGIVLALFGHYWPLGLVLGSYFFGALAMSVYDCLRTVGIRGIPLIPLLPIGFLVMHVSNGLGNLCGLLRIPQKLREWRGYKLPWPVKARASA